MFESHSSLGKEGSYLKFQVLRQDGSVIKGLYAGGETVNRPYYRRVYTSGTGLGLAYTSGRIAGENAAKE